MIVWEGKRLFLTKIVTIITTLFKNLLGGKKYFGFFRNLPHWWDKSFFSKYEKYQNGKKSLEVVLQLIWSVWFQQNNNFCYNYMMIDSGRFNSKIKFHGWKNLKILNECEYYSCYICRDELQDLLTSLANRPKVLLRRSRKFSTAGYFYYLLIWTKKGLNLFKELNYLYMNKSLGLDIIAGSISTCLNSEWDILDMKNVQIFLTPK